MSDKNVRFGFERIWAEGDYSKSENLPRLEKENQEYHNLRKELVTALAEVYDLKLEPALEVEKLNDEEPHEFVELIIALGSAGVFTAVVQAFKIWVNRKKIKSITMTLPDGTTKSIENVTADDAKRLGF